MSKDNEDKTEKTQTNQEENISEEKSKKKDSDKTKKVRYEVVVEAPKTRLITAIVMLAGGLCVAIYTGLEGYDTSTWLYILLVSLIIFLIAGLLLEWMVVHFLKLNNAKDEAIAAQEEAIAQRQAYELAAEEAEKQRRLEELAQQAENDSEEALNVQSDLPNDYDAFGESDEFEEF